MTRLMRRATLAVTLVVVGTAGAAAATCSQVNQLMAQGFSDVEIASALGASVGAVQSCARQRPVVIGPAGPAPLGAAGPAPFGASGPAPLGAAGPAPMGAAGRAPIGAAGPAPIGAAGPAPVGSANKAVKATR